MKKKVLVINYHKIDQGDSVADLPLDKIFSVTMQAFEQQLEILRRNKVPLVSLHDIIHHKVSKAFSVAITVDDGNASDYEIVYPMLKARSIPATFFWLSGPKKSNVWQKAVEMTRNGFTIGSHGVSHRGLTEMSKEEKMNELVSSRKELEEKTRSSVLYFAFPYGLYDSETVKMVRESGYLAACTTDVKPNTPGKDFLIHRWNVKRTTSLQEFEAMVCNKNILRRKTNITQLTKIIKRMVGKRLTNTLTIFFNQNINSPK